MPSILVIDDEAAIRAAVERILTASGYEVCVVNDGRAGLDAVAQAPFAAAIVDLCMPQMDGLDAIRALRAVAPAMPLILMSGLMADCAGDAPDFLGMTANLAGVRRLAKPFRQEDLLDLVAKCCASVPAHEGQTRAA